MTETPYTYTVTDEDGDSATLTFTITVVEDLQPVFSDAIENQIYLQKQRDCNADLAHSDRWQWHFDVCAESPPHPMVWHLMRMPAQ